MQPDPNRPNVLLITVDQWRGDCLGSAGQPALNVLESVIASWAERARQ